LLGVDALTYFNSLVVQAAIGRFGGGADGFLSAFRAKTLASGLSFNQAFNNVEFVGLVNTFGSLSDAISAINALDVVRFQFISRLGFSRFAGQPIRRALLFSRLRFFQIGLSQIVVYRFTNFRFTGGTSFPAGLFNKPRSSDNDN
jgi:hypothetical protein